ncbi:MAG: GNAT family N-acetyltransferase [Fusobacteriaceae bacterium]
MNIRYAKDKCDKKQAQDIWKRVFTDPKEYVDFYFEKKYSEKKFILIEENSVFLGGLHENSYEFNFYENFEKSKYLVAVAVLPEKRNKGVFNSLIQYSLKNMKNRGMRETFLIPSNPSIYEKYGFKYSHSLEKYSFSFEDLENFKMEFEIFEAKEVKELTKFYNESMEKFTSCIKKTEKDIAWDLEELNFEGGYAYCVKFKEVIVGSFAYNISENKVKIKNLLYKDLKVLKTIFSFFKSFKEYYSEIEVISFEGSALERVFSNMKHIKKEVYPLIMTRILNPERLIKEFVTYKKLNLNFILDLEDNLFSENSKKYYIGKNSLENSLILKLNINTLTELIYGSYTLDELVENEKIHFVNLDIKNEETMVELKKIFVKGKNYIEQYV